MSADACVDTWCNTGTSPMTQCIQSGSAAALRLMMIMSRRAPTLSGSELERVLSCCTGTGHVHAAQEPDSLSWQQAAETSPCLMFCSRAPLVDLEAIDFMVNVSKAWVMNNVSKQRKNKSVQSIATLSEPVSRRSSLHELVLAPAGTCAGLLSVLLDDVLLHYR